MCIPAMAMSGIGLAQKVFGGHSSISPLISPALALMTSKKKKSSDRPQYGGGPQGNSSGVLSYSAGGA